MKMQVKTFTEPSLKSLEQTLEKFYSNFTKPIQILDIKIGNFSFTMKNEKGCFWYAILHYIEVNQFQIPSLQSNVKP